MSLLTDFAVASPKSIFVLYLIISGNFLANLFGCRTQEAFNTNMWLKHLLGFMTLYFFVVLADSKSKLSDSPTQQFGFSILFYLLFLLTTRMDYKWWLAMIIGLAVVYIMQVYKEHDKTEEELRQQLGQYQTYLVYLLSVVLVVGVIVYYGKKKIEYGENFNPLKFLVGNPSCSFNREPVPITDIDAIKRAVSSA